MQRWQCLCLCWVLTAVQVGSLQDEIGTSKAEPNCSLSHWWVPSTTERDVKFYFPDDGDRCFMAATSTEDTGRCPTNDSIFENAKAEKKSGMCARMPDEGSQNSKRMSERRSLWMQLQSQGNVSHVAMLAATLNEHGWTLEFDGDSVTDMIFFQFGNRLKEVRRMEQMGLTHHPMPIPRQLAKNVLKNAAGNRVWTVSYGNATRDNAYNEHGWEKWRATIKSSLRGQKTVYIYSSGLHIAKFGATTVKVSLGHALDALEYLGERFDANQFVPLYLETVTQHFQSDDGSFEKWCMLDALCWNKLRKFKGGWLAEAAAEAAQMGVSTFALEKNIGAADLERKKEYACVPLPAEKCGKTPSQITQRIARELFSERNYTRVGLLPLGEITAALWDLHNGVKAMDCTHYCYVPQIVEALALSIRRQLPGGSSL